jgi:hypothetical protein
MLKLNESVWLSQLEFPAEVKMEDRENNERKRREVKACTV